MHISFTSLLAYIVLSAGKRCYSNPRILPARVQRGGCPTIQGLYKVPSKSTEKCEQAVKTKSPSRCYFWLITSKNIEEQQAYPEVFMQKRFMYKSLLTVE